MEFKTAEEKLLHDYAVLEDENMRLVDANRDLERRLHDMEVDRDHKVDCIKDMLAAAAFYGIEQPRMVRYNPAKNGVEAVEEA